MQLFICNGCGIFIISSLMLLLLRLVISGDRAMGNLMRSLGCCWSLIVIGD